MRLLRFFVVGVLVEATCAGVMFRVAVAQDSTPSALPALVASPPQQMPVYGTPEVSPYPSTSAPEVTAALAPYNDVMPGAATPASVSNNNSGDNGNDSGPLYAPYGSPDAMTAARAADANANAERAYIGRENWRWQLMPTGLLYKTYLAGAFEPRIGSTIVHERTRAWLWNASAGARVGIVRFGTDDPLYPQGWQLDIEGAAFPRLDLENQEDMVSCDFRAGIPLTTRQGPWEAKFGYYHLSSHLGDEYILTHDDYRRINYVRESLLLGLAVYLNPSLRLYSEAGWAFYTDGGAKPWEFQFGVDFSSPEPSGPTGDPFFAINAHLRQENDFGGNLSVQTGWQWRGRTGQLFRLGMQYFNGMSDQRQFYDSFEEQIGFGVWYDF